ncbi:MAG: glycosyltransferase family 2 protein [Bacteroidota bacterium]
MPAISIVILCYRAGEDAVAFVEETYAGFKQAGVDFELVLVGNYHEGDESDATPAVVQRLAEQYPRCVAVALPKQGMMGWDARTGLAAATGDVLGFVDGDNQFPAESILAVYQKLVEEDLDLCKTVRITRHDGVYRRLLSSGYNLVFQVLFPGGRFRDVNSKPKFVRRGAYERMRLSSDDWFIDAEMMIEARRLGLKVGEVPVVFRANTRPSFVKPAAVWEFVGNLLRARFT